MRRTLCSAVAAGTVAAALLGSAGAVAAKAPAAGARYEGRTSEGTPVSFRVSADGRRVVGFTTTLGYNGRCGQGGGPGYQVKATGIAIGAGGRFTATVNGTFGSLKPVRLKLRGRIKRKHASGSLVEPGALRCEAGPHRGASAYAETFTAKAR